MGNIPLDVRRSEVIEAFRALRFEFEDANRRAVRAYSPYAILELDTGRRLSVSLLVSVGRLPRSSPGGAVALATMESALGVPFLSWLSSEIRARGLVRQWEARHRAAGFNVIANFLSSDAMLVTVYG